jgi:DNA-3-methyladenine glycosylase II
MREVILHFERADPAMAPVVAAAFAGDVPIAVRAPAPPEKYFERLADAITGQQLSVKAADTIWGRFTALLDNQVTPEHVLGLSVEQMRSVGLSGQKAGYMHLLAQSFMNGDIRADELPSMSNEEVIEELTRLKGIGPWTAEMFLMFTLGRPDVFSYLDLGLVRAFEQVYGITGATRTHMEPKVVLWAPYRTYAALALWRLRDNKPVLKEDDGRW